MLPDPFGPNRPALLYHGGKWLLAPWILEHFPSHRIYTEAYGGAASVLLRKPRAYGEIYNDLDQEIVNVFRVLRDPAQASMLATLLRLTPFSREEFDLSYVPASDPLEQARRTIYRSFAGFASTLTAEYLTGFRVNNLKAGRHPAASWADYPDLIATFTARLQGVVIESKPALAVLTAYDGPDVLHYVDPPYVWATRGRYGGKGYRHELSDDEHRELANVLHGLSGMVVLSGYPSALYADLYPDFWSTERQALSDGGYPRTEVLWLNAAACAALEESSPPAQYGLWENA